MAAIRQADAEPHRHLRRAGAHRGERRALAGCRGDPDAPAARLCHGRGDRGHRRRADGAKQWIEDALLPIVSFVYPIPGSAYAPLFILWFGLGDLPTILLVGIASSFVIILNTWKGVKSVKPIWLRSAEVMGAGDRDVLQADRAAGRLPYVMVGLDLASPMPGAS